MARPDVDADQFARALGDILSDVQRAGDGAAVEGVRTGIREGAKAWRRDARKSIGTHEYKRSGETITSGAYAKSIRSHMTDTDERHPAGEVGSPKMAGLSHLLNDGHAKVGGGRVAPVLHIDESAEVAFDAAERAAAMALERGLE